MIFTTYDLSNFSKHHYPICCERETEMPFLLMVLLILYQMVV